jgi:hypothetical protein
MQLDSIHQTRLEELGLTSKGGCRGFTIRPVANRGGFFYGANRGE